MSRHCVAVLLGLLGLASPTLTPRLLQADPRAASFGHARLAARLGGETVPRSAPQRIEVDQGTAPYAQATIQVLVPRAADLVGGVVVGTDVEVVCPAGSSASPVFQGEVVAVEPVKQAGGDVVVIQAYDRLHRLTRGRKTRTFLDVTDSDIVGLIAREHGLWPMPAPDLTHRYDEVLQENQTDLEFLRLRAARIGFDVWLEGPDGLRFAPRPPSAPVRLAPRRPDGDVRLLLFHPRLATHDTVQEVVVRGWDPVREEPHEGSAAAPSIVLVPGPFDPASVLGATVEFLTDQPVFSDEEAEALAATTLALLSANRVSGEALTRGDARLAARGLVDLAGVDARFSGRYLVQRATHEYSSPPDEGAGYQTKLRLHRQDGGLFFLPEIDDEVLVGFDHGDLRHPIVVGSLWNDDGSTADGR